MKSNTAQNGMAVTRLVAALLITLTVCTLSAPSWAMARPPRLGGGGGPGAVSVVLTWATNADVDLTLVPSTGFTGTGDRLCDPDPRTESFENANAARGVYAAGALVFDICTGNSVVYTVTVNRAGVAPLVATQTGTGGITDPSRTLAVPFTF